MQWNLNGYYNNYEELRQLISLKQPRIICLQETRLHPHHTPKLNSYQIHRFAYTNALIAAEGVATLIHNSIILKDSIQLNTNIQNITLRIKTCHPLPTLEFTTCNIYLPPHTEPKYADLCSLVAQLPQLFILLGDCNVHSTSWGSYKINTKGKLFDKLLQQHPQLFLLNNNKSTRFNISNGTSSAIDLSISSTNLGHLLS